MMQGATPAPAIGSVPFEAEQFTHATVLLSEAVDALDIKQMVLISIVHLAAAGIVRRF